MKPKLKRSQIFANLESNEIANVMMMKRRMPVAKDDWHVKWSHTCGSAGPPLLSWLPSLGEETAMLSVLMLMLPMLMLPMLMLLSWLPYQGEEKGAMLPMLFRC